MMRTSEPIWKDDEPNSFRKYVPETAILLGFSEEFQNIVLAFRTQGVEQLT